MFERRDYLIFSTVYLAFTFSTLLWIGGLRDLGLLAGMFVGCLLALMFAVTGSEMRRLAREAELRRAVAIPVRQSSPVSTARTPGIAAAADLSIPLSTACAYVDLTTAI